MHIIADMRGVDRALEAIKTFSASVHPVQLFEIEEKIEEVAQAVANMIGSAVKTSETS